MEDFNSLFPAEVTVVVAGETFTLRAFTARHLRPYLNITERLAEKADDLGRKLGHKLATRILGLPADTPHDVVQNARAAYAGPESFEVTDIPLEAIHQACAEEYLDLVAVGLNKPLAWVEELGIDDLVVLAGVIQKLNNDRYLKKPSALTVVATAQKLITITLADAISQLVLERGMPLEAVMNLTPKTIWYLFEQSATLNARSRLQLVSDMTAAAAPSQFEEGGKLLDSHLKHLAQLGDVTAD